MEVKAEENASVNVSGAGPTALCLGFCLFFSGKKLQDISVPHGAVVQSAPVQL